MAIIKVSHAYHSSCRRARRRNNGCAHRRALRQRGSARASLGHRRPRPAQSQRRCAERHRKRRSNSGPADSLPTIRPPSSNPAISKTISISSPNATGSSKPSSRTSPLKRDLWHKVESVRKPDAIVSTNTSGIPLAQISEGFSQPTSARHFLGTHFFNPPRYLHLMEMIPGADTNVRGARHRARTSPTAASAKAWSSCKDTPNFIANRIGSFFGGTIAKIDGRRGFHRRRSGRAHRPADRPAQQRQLPPARYRRPGCLGVRRQQSVRRRSPTIPGATASCRPIFRNKMIERKWLGDKTGQGFYKRVGKGDNKEIHALDWKTLEYHPAAKPRFASVEAARRHRRSRRAPAHAGALRTIAPARFLWKVFSDLFLYSAEWFPKFRIASSKSTAPCAGATPTNSGPSSFGTRWASWTCITRLEMEHRDAARKHAKDMLARGAISLYRHDADQRRADAPSISIFLEARLSATGGAPRHHRRSPTLKRANGVVQQNRGSVADRSGRRRAVRRVPQQDECAGRRQHRHALRRPRRAEHEFRRHGDRQRGRKFQRRREPDDGSAGRAGRRMGRAECRHPPLPAGQYGFEVCGQAGGFRALSRARWAAAARSRCIPRARRLRPRPTWAWWKSASA